VQHVYWITSVDRTGNQSAASASAAAAAANNDLVPPTVPGGFSVLSGDSAATVSWTASTDAFGVTGYEVWMQDTFVGAWIKIADVNTTAFTRLGLANGSCYRFKVRAYDAANTVRIEDTVGGVANPAITWVGNWKSYSGSAYSGGTMRALESSGSASMDFTGTGISIKVDAMYYFNRGYMDVFIDNAFSTRVDLYSVSASYTAPVYSSGTLPDGPHTIRVQWVSTPNPISGRTLLDIDCFDVTTGPDITAPPTPGTITVADLAGDETGRVSVAWSPSAGIDLAGYKLYRATDVAGPFEYISCFHVPSASYIDSGLTNGTTYYYRVTAVDTSGNESAPRASGGVVPSPQ
jgi:fibronectin type 3 domain-containing protein